MKDQGDLYEQRAAIWLCDQGLHIVARNFRSKTGEIDIIARDNATLVFVEVRARNNPRFSTALGSVDYRKQQKLLRTAQSFLKRHPQFKNSACRFDVIAFDQPQSVLQPQVKWVRGAFTA